MLEVECQGKAGHYLLTVIVRTPHSVCSSLSKASANEFSQGGKSAISLMLSVLDSTCCRDYITMLDTGHWVGKAEALSLSMQISRHYSNSVQLDG